MESENGENIKEQLRTRKYKPQPVRRVEIPKPDGGVRNPGVPTVDRFVQQAVAQVHCARSFLLDHDGEEHLTSAAVLLFTENELQFPLNCRI